RDPPTPTSEITRLRFSALVVGAISGVAAWLLFVTGHRHVPESVRFGAVLLLFVVGPASLVLGGLFGGLALVDELIVLAALGVGIGPAVGDLLGRFHAIALFPYLAAIGGGMFVFRAVARRHRPVSSAADRRALLVLLSIAFLT